MVMPPKLTNKTNDTMKQYTVKFYYGTDLRTDWTGEARNDIAALTLAMNDKLLDEWAVCTQFRVEIIPA